jgi:hypothetical protein
MVKLDRCLLINKYIEIKKIPVKKDVPKATTTTADGKDKQPDADNKGKEQQEETGDADSKKNGHMEDVSNQQEQKENEKKANENDMADTPKEEGNNEEVKKDEVKKDEAKKDEAKKDEVKKDETIPAPVQEYEEVKKQKKREIECLFSFTPQEGR